MADKDQLMESDLPPKNASHSTALGQRQIRKLTAILQHLDLESPAIAVNTKNPAHSDPTGRLLRQPGLDDQKKSKPRIGGSSSFGVGACATTLHFSPANPQQDQPLTFSSGPFGVADGTWLFNIVSSRLLCRNPIQLALPHCPRWWVRWGVLLHIVADFGASRSSREEAGASTAYCPMLSCVKFLLVFLVR
ncbi:hypothetical protein VFPPC_15988 [Pochonia chlamydosporia 170]|uniref:Uncharacterized protein n=1 Tax=Pochonia chlamydosporia 170 TaxID=1380566 RepID=A0A179FMA0_METCM|nr:hypothetical protein VFPPC_15988 [Pochonia chlamydosporia 170]OAQ66149.1 hypothetical protein VFPPC_15988 [Pochonia chlamydosporia 170]